MRDKVKAFTAYSVALDESTDRTDNAQLTIFIRGINKVQSERRVAKFVSNAQPHHIQRYIFQELCVAFERTRLPWSRLVGITTDRAPSMTGRKNGLVALVQRKLEEEKVGPAVVLHCIIDRHALCSMCLKYEHGMSVVLKYINYIRSRSLQHR